MVDGRVETLKDAGMPSTAVRRARTAVATAFAVNGLAFAAFASRVPAIRDVLGLTIGQTGLLLLCLSGGAVAGLPLAGPVVQRHGAARAVFAGAVVVTAGLALLGAALLTASVAPAAAGLALTGLGSGTWDVAMNVEGAAVERDLARPLMPRLHAGFSLGTVAGAGLGTAASATNLPVAVQVLLVSALAAPAMAVATRRFLPYLPADPPQGTRWRLRGARGRPRGSLWRGRARSGARSGAGAEALTAWGEPRTLAVGLLVLAFAFTEGSANDWLAVALVSGHRADQTLGALAFALFVTAMTVGRLAGGWALQRFGRVPVLRATAVLALAGLVLVLAGGSVALALAGSLLWGIGASLGFPVGMSAAADDPARAAGRVSVASSIGYTAFLAGPPLIGLLAQRYGILAALTVVLAALAVGLVAAGASRPR